MAKDRHMPEAEPRYAFDNAWVAAERRLTELERLLDPGSIQHLSRLAVGPGWSCLEVGAGRGSIARWLAEHVAPTGRVLATDLDPRFLVACADATLTVQQHDITADPLPEAAFDLVHARLVLMHLPAREQALATLIRGLRPGGWLLLEEQVTWLWHPDAPPAAAALFERVQQAMACVTTARGMDLGWGNQLHRRLREEGLLNVEAAGACSRHAGGSQGATLWTLNVEQLRSALLGAGGLSEEDLVRYQALLEDPSITWLTPLVVATWGRRPPV
jgi:SAM-dependent methyltransferase